MVLGRITQAPSSQGQGQPAWILGPYSEGTDDAKATAWLAAHPRQGVSQPSGPPASRAAGTTTPAPAASPSPVAGQVITPEIAALLAQIQQTQG